MNNKKIWLFFIPLFISLFVFGRPVKAEENNSLDSAVSLSLNQTLTRSVDKNVVLRHYYKIELSQKSAITIYGKFTVDTSSSREMDIELQDVNGKCISHQNLSLLADGDYRWRTEEIDSGIYYILLGSDVGNNSTGSTAITIPYVITEYSIAYSFEPYPVCTELAQDTEIKCKPGINVFKINVTSPTDLTIYGTEGIERGVSVKFADVNGKEISCQSEKSSQTEYKTRVKGLLPGTYYIETKDSSKLSDYSYSVLYSTDPYPESKLLERGDWMSGSLRPGFSSNIYKININAKHKITFFYSIDYPQIGLRLYDSETNCIDHMEFVTEKKSFKWSEWSLGEELMPGTYYLEVSSGGADYNIKWQISGLSATDDLTMTKATNKTITLSWNVSQKASKYKIYKYNKKTKDYSLCKTTTATSCKISGLKTSTTYTFKVVPVVSVNGEDIEGDKTYFKAATKPAKVSVKSIKKTKSGKVSGNPVNYYKIGWKKVKNADGYQVYVKTKGGKWKTVNSTSSKSCMIHVVKGYTAQIKVRAYITTKDATTYGSFSKIKTIKNN